MPPPAQFETEIRAEPQIDGILNAKARGVHMGRRKSLIAQEISQLQLQREQGALIKSLMEEYNLSKASVYRYLDGIKVVPTVS